MQLKLICAAVLTATTCSSYAAESTEFFGNLRSGIISSEDADGDNTSATAIGGKLGFISRRRAVFEPEPRYTPPRN